MGSDGMHFMLKVVFDNSKIFNTMYHICDNIVKTK